MTVIDSKILEAIPFAENLIGFLDKGVAHPYQEENPIKEVFERYSIPYKEWTEPQRKRFFDQVKFEETVIYVIDREWTQGRPTPQVVRFSEVVALRVFRPNGEDELFEYKFDKNTKEFKVKTEEGKTIPGISEKIIGKETSVAAAVRGLQEELKMTISPERIEELKMTISPERIEEDTKPSKFLFKPDERGFYVGLRVHHFVLRLNQSDPICDVYREKDNKFQWGPKLV